MANWFIFLSCQEIDKEVEETQREVASIKTETKTTGEGETGEQQPSTEEEQDEGNRDTSG